jgi:hypothetical protein
VKLFSLLVQPPSFLPGISPEPLEGELSALAGPLGADLQCRTARGMAEFESAWAPIRHAARPDEVTLLVVTGHGRRVRPRTRAEADNLLLVQDTDPTEQTATSVNLDQYIQELRQAAAGPLLVLLDICAVELRESRDAGGSLAVLLANPTGNAEAVEGTGILTRAFFRSLREAQPESTLRSIINRTIVHTRAETGERQNPKLVGFGDQQFLDRLLRPIADPQRPVELPTKSLRAMVEALRDMALKDALPSSVRAALQNAFQEVAPTDNDTFELRLALAALQARDQPGAQAVEALKALLERVREIPISVTTRVHAMHLLAHVLHRMGGAAGRASGSPHAQALLQDALPLAGPDLRPRLLDTLGTIHRESVDLRKAVACYKESLGSRQGDPVGAEITRQNLGWCSLLLGEFGQGESYFREGTNVCLQHLDNPQREAGLAGLTSTLKSLLYHVAGLATSVFLRT